MDDDIVDELNPMAEEHGMDDIVNEVEVDNNAIDDENGDIDDYEALIHVPDTSAANARQGRDIQGIRWDKLGITREIYKLLRLKHYKSYENVPGSSEAVKECKPTDVNAKYYDFFFNTRTVKPTISHLQLRNLVWATSKHDVYFMSNYKAMHWSSMVPHLSEVLNFEEHVKPYEKHEGSFPEGFTRTRISTIAVKDNFFVAGGFMGELVCKRLHEEKACFCTRSTYADNGITKSLEIYDSLSGGHHFMASNDDCRIREYEMERFQLLNHFCFPWKVNHTSISPDRKLVAVVGDHIDGLLFDSQSRQVVSTMAGHRDYSFASAWHPNGRFFATGSQDKTCRVWDVRNVSKPVSILKCSVGSVGSIRFSSDGDFMVVAETADYVHVYSTKENYEKEQEIDSLGEISGVSMSPDDECLYIGIYTVIRDDEEASLLQYNRRHTYKYLDAFF